MTNMQSQTLKVLNRTSNISCFGNVLVPVNSDSLSLPFRSKKETEEHINNEFDFVKHLTNCVLLRQQIDWPNISLTLNLSNVSNLPDIYLRNVVDSSNVITKSTNETVNLNASLINQSLFNSKTLCILKEFGVISNKRSNGIQALMGNNVSGAKRQAPDFDDYHVIPSKRIKPCTNRKETDIDFNSPQQECNQTVIQKEIESSQVITDKWDVNRITDPHIDHTRCTHISLQHNRWNQSCIWQDQLCLLPYDEEIGKLDITLSTLGQDIFCLRKLYSMTYMFGTSCEINDKLWQLQQRENILQNRYAALCDSRDEIYHLYVKNKQAELSFDAPFISINDVSTIKINRQMLNNFSYYYPV